MNKHRQQIINKRFNLTGNKIFNKHFERVNERLQYKLFKSFRNKNKKIRLIEIEQY